MEVKKRIHKRKIRFRFYVYLMIAVFAYAGVSLFTQYNEMQKLKAEQKALEKQIEDAQLSMDKLRNLIEIADTDEYIESIAREKLGWVKPSETRFVIKEED